MTTLTAPDLAGFKTIDDSQIESFRKNGHVLIPGILNQTEVAYYRNVINRAATEYNTEKRSLKDRDTYGKAFLQITNLWEVDEQVRNFSLAKRFGKIAADLLGVENVRMYHDQALYKEPGGGFTPWHQDQYYWPVDTNNTVTMWMPLIDITEEMGMLTFASRSHESGFVENVAISDESEAMLERYIQQKGFQVSRAKTMHAGDATWHYGWTLHSAPGNKSEDIMREVMTIIFVADGASVTEPQNKHQEADRQRWMSGLPTGSLLDSSLNPLIL
ncbi:phytanoyl-CoA dioxygenase family protein [Dyadobacter sediminis]|uniref:Phytanoyl-CoA dioxygenase family protein n=1 Tax=Dyadobacter sediminis TaxID=1493691 RepID=A0A5R9K863_9BACT|nr:phytanoyl-CoA dioxygenase family protein [Dyadobacter sediminis]TLU90034.1 phytanoyl-CoA dioxygenase family protein [Dyadobacter sediminis]GGC10744.1 SnoK [Dyadobacter sediminis]